VKVGGGDLSLHVCDLGEVNKNVAFLVENCNLVARVLSHLHLNGNPLVVWHEESR